MKLSGEAVPLITDLAFVPRIAHTVFSASSDVLIARRGSGVSVSKLVWFDRKGNELGSVDKPEIVANVALAPDGKTVAVDRTDEESQNTDLWTYDLQRGAAKRLTFDPAVDSTPVFSPDGKQILFSSSRGHVFQLYVKDADGAQEEKLIPLDASDNSNLYPSDWSRDGKSILYTRATELWAAQIAGLESSPGRARRRDVEEWAILPGRPLGGLRLQRERWMGSLRHVFSGRPGKMASLDGWRIINRVGEATARSFSISLPTRRSWPCRSLAERISIRAAPCRSSRPSREKWGPPPSSLRTT